MTEKIITNLVDNMVNRNVITPEQKEEYIYALECIVETFITVSSIIIISLFMDNAIPTVVFLLFFFSLRKRTGGFHLNSFLRCYICSVILYIILALSAVYVKDYIYVLLVFTGVAGITVLIIGAVNHPNICMDDRELRCAVTSARLMSIIEMFIIAFFVWIKADAEIIVYNCMSILLCAILLIIAKLTGQEVKDNG